MNIYKMFLNNENSLKVNGVSLGSTIAAKGKTCLWEERVGSIIDVVVIHYISAVEITPMHPFDEERILNIFCEYEVSSHYMINRLGKIMILVPEEKKAWHCGGSMMPEPDNRIAVNDFSIGIELMATENSGFTQSQYCALSKLCFDIETRHNKKFTYVGHDQVAGKRAVDAGLRKIEKVDPGSKFDWDTFKSEIENMRLAEIRL
jgi:N-acetylmuramoyl-L-alanine amidase